MLPTRQSALVFLLIHLGPSNNRLNQSEIAGPKLTPDAESENMLRVERNRTALVSAPRSARSTPQRLPAKASGGRLPGGVTVGKTSVFDEIQSVQVVGSLLFCPICSPQM